MNFATLIILGLLTLAVIWILITLRRMSRSGKSSCGCGCSCNCGPDCDYTPEKNCGCKSQG